MDYKQMYFELKTKYDNLDEELNTLKKENTELKKIAYNDSLTNLYNRRGLSNKLKQYKDSFFTIALCDVDNFKSVNDNFGHSEGDKFLKQVAYIIDSCKRNDDLAVRFGGDEFVIFFKDCPIDIAYSKMNAIREKIYQEGVKLGIDISLSAGLILYDGSDKLSDVLSLADDALYNSKENGKNQITIVNSFKKKR